MLTGSLEFGSDLSVQELGSLFTVLRIAGEQLYGVFASRGTQVRWLAVTERRLLILETISDVEQLTSEPFRALSRVSYLLPPGRSVTDAMKVRIEVRGKTYDLVCLSEERARYLHDLVVLRLTEG